MGHTGRMWARASAQAAGPGSADPLLCGPNTAAWGGVHMGGSHRILLGGTHLLLCCNHQRPPAVTTRLTVTDLLDRCYGYTVKFRVLSLLEMHVAAFYTQYSIFLFSSSRDVLTHTTSLAEEHPRSGSCPGSPHCRDVPSHAALYSGPLLPWMMLLCIAFCT